MEIALTSRETITQKMNTHKGAVLPGQDRAQAPTPTHRALGVLVAWLVPRLDGSPLSEAQTATSGRSHEPAQQHRLPQGDALSSCPSGDGYLSGRPLVEVFSARGLRRSVYVEDPDGNVIDDVVVQG